MARSLVVPRAGQTLVLVANFSDQPIYLRSDLPVAEYHLISGVNGTAVPIEVEPESKPSSHPSCSSIG